MNEEALQRVSTSRFFIHAVDSLNIKDELQSKRVKQFCIMIFLGLPLENHVYFLHELKQRSSDVTGSWH